MQELIFHKFLSYTKISNLNFQFTFCYSPVKKDTFSFPNLNRSPYIIWKIKIKNIEILK